MLDTYTLADLKRRDPMSCPKTTPEGSPHEVHAGTKIAPGVFLNERKLCVHAASDGSSPVVVTVTLDEVFAEAIAYATETQAFGPTPEPVKEAEAPKRRRERNK